MERLRNRTRADMGMAELLDQHCILYEIEKVLLNGDRHILADFYIPSALLVIEVDGGSHDNRKSYDAGRDKWLYARNMECGRYVSPTKQLSRRKTMCWVTFFVHALVW
jgi:very-short-patch-repair endonuclease